MRRRFIVLAGSLALGLAIHALRAASADDVQDPFVALPTLDEAQLGDSRSKRSSGKWSFIPAEPKPSKVGKIPIPEFGGLVDQQVYGGATGQLPLSGFSRAPDTGGSP